MSGITLITFPQCVKCKDDEKNIAPTECYLTRCFSKEDVRFAARPPEIYTWNTPILNSRSSCAWLAALMPSDITLRVSPGSMISSTQRRAAA